MEYYYRNQDKEKERRDTWREENPELFQESQKKSGAKYYQNNKEKVNQRCSQTRAADPCVRILNSSYGNAKKRGLEHNLKIKYIREIYPKDNKCPILGIELTNILQTQSDSKVGSNPSIDRIDSSLGYVEGNVWVISWQANKMKSDATKDELLAFAKGVLKVYGDDS